MKFCYNEDNFIYEDDFELVGEEERNVYYELVVDIGIVDRVFIKFLEFLI